MTDLAEQEGWYSDILSADKYLPYFGGHLQERVRAIKSPFPTVNKACHGTGMGRGPAEGWLVVIAGNPGTGKTVVGLNNAVTAIEQGDDVAICTMEMTRHELAPRVYASLLPNREADLVGRGSRFDPGRFKALHSAVSEVREKYGARLVVNSEPIRSKKGLYEFATNCYESLGIRYLIFDYIQLACQGDDQNIYGETVEVVNWLSRFARERGVRVDALSQFNRSTSSDYSQAPRSQGLHGGMVVEASSDMIWLIDHSRWERDTMRKHITRTFLMVDKNRYGPDFKGRGDRDGIPIEFNFQTMRVREAQDRELDIWPSRKKKDGR